MQKLRIGVLMGGKSIEKEVSFNSGRTVCDHLDTSLYDIMPIFQTAMGDLYLLPYRFLHRGKISDFEHRLTTQATKIIWDDLPNIIDFMYICTHGSYAEDGRLQGFLELLGIPYLGSKILASALGMDKSVHKKILQQHGLAVPNGITLSAYEIAQLDTQMLIEQLRKAQLSAPYVVKPNNEGSSFGIAVVSDVMDLHTAILRASTINPEKPQSVLVEEKIEGMEFTCITLTNYEQECWLPLPPIEIVHEKGIEFLDYEQKYMPGRALKFSPPRCSADITRNIQETCIKASDILGFTNLSRMDGFVDHAGNVVLIEANTLSGMGPSGFIFREAAAINMNHSQLINHLIATELYTYGMRNTMTFAPEFNDKTAHKLRIAVLMGGASNEKETSLDSGRNIFYKLSPRKYESIPLFVDTKNHLYRITTSMLVCNTTHEIEVQLTASMRINWNDLPSIADFVFIGLHGGLGENGGVQGALEMLELPYNGSGVLASALCMDKYKTTQFLKSYGFDVPEGYLVTQQRWFNDQEAVIFDIESIINFPCIVKPHDDGCSVMVAKVETLDQLRDHINTILNHKNAALVEELVAGMELTVGVLGNENPHALPPSQAVAQSGILSIQEKFLPGAGENQTPAPLPAHTLSFVQSVITDVFKTVSCIGYARIDCFYQTAAESKTGQERVVILEINTLPGMTPATCIFHQAAEIGLKPMDFIDEIITLGMQAHGHQKISLAESGKDLHKVTAAQTKEYEHTP